MQAPLSGRIALGVEYLGTHYYGWQRLSHGPSIQAALEEAIARVADHPVEIMAAGRTDAQVHAVGQVAHFDTPAVRRGYQWMLGINSHLPSDISVTWILQAQLGFHARFSAIWRSYRYVIVNRLARSALHHDRVCWYHYPLDEQAMHRAAQCLIGEHDFSAFRASACQARTASRRIHEINVSRLDDLVLIDVRANAFLHHMVRNIAGVLMIIGKGDAPENWAHTILQQRDRTLGGFTAPAQGLYLTGVGYPEHLGLPAATGAAAVPAMILRG
jgi:tRNA pseudouridine38-40 synthase